MNKGTKKQFAFTLIELLVVIAIIGILSALIIVGMSSTTQKATIAKAQVFSHSIDSALMSSKLSEWKFDESSGTTVYDSWGTKNGTSSGAQIKTTGCISGNCLSFNGSASVNCGNIGIPEGGPATISGWFYFTNLTPTQNFHSMSYRGGAGWLSVYIAGTSTYFPGLESVFVANTWYNVIFTYSGVASTGKSYVNTVLRNAQNQYGENPLVPALGTFYIGAPSGFYGFIDDVQIYNQIIPTSQIKQIYFAGINKLFAKNQITQTDYQQRLAELSNNYVKE